MEYKSRNKGYKSAKCKHWNRYDLLCLPLLTMRLISQKHIILYTLSLSLSLASNCGYAFNFVHLILFIHQTGTIANIWRDVVAASSAWISKESERKKIEWIIHQMRVEFAMVWYGHFSLGFILCRSSISLISCAFEKMLWALETTGHATRFRKSTKFINK